MFIRESRLSPEEKAAYADCLEKLQGEGIDVEIPEEGEQNSRLVIELAPPPESMVFESATGGIYYASPVRLLALQSGLTLIDWDLATDRDDQIVAEFFDGGSPICKLGQQEFRRCEVLNHQIESGLPLRRGRSVERWILASGLRPIPPDCSIMPFTVRFFDQFRREYLANGTLSVMRRPQRDRSNGHRGTGLYGLDGTAKPRELSVSEESARRHRELRFPKTVEDIDAASK